MKESVKGRFFEKYVGGLSKTKKMGVGERETNLVIFKTIFGYVLGDIYPKNA